MMRNMNLCRRCARMSGRGWTKMQNERIPSTGKVNRQLAIAICLLMVVISCQRPSQKRAVVVVVPPAPVVEPLPQNASPQLKQLIEAAIEQSKITTGYDPSWVKIDYPNGDVPSDTGVCSDVVVRAFRKTGIDLQKEVHEDM